jgi:hypothetical protein
MLLQELGCSASVLPSLRCDNLSIIFLATNPVFHARIKHIKLNYHFIREKLTAKQLSIYFICSNDQIADIFTKSLAKTKFLNFQDKLPTTEFEWSFNSYSNEEVQL